jgi:hypothetical protein
LRPSIVIGDARKAGMDIGAAEVFRRDDLAGRRLHQRRAAEEDGAMLLEEHRLLSHRPHI